MNKAVKLPFFKRGDSNEIAINAITVKAFRDIPHVNNENLTSAHHFAQRKAMILSCTDIIEAEFETFTAPDFNTLSEAIQSFILTPSDELKGEPLENSDFTYDLLFPFDNDLGDNFNHIKFQVPKVTHSQALAELNDDQQREDFMFTVVCGFGNEDIQLMKLNDYLTLKPKVGDFFIQSGDYFHPTTLTA